MTGKTYKVTKKGVSQRIKGTDEFEEIKVGEEITLSPEAAEHLILTGYVEDPKRRRKEGDE